MGEPAKNCETDEDPSVKEYKKTLEEVRKKSMQALETGMPTEDKVRATVARLRKNGSLRPLKLEEEPDSDPKVVLSGKVA